jgi:hypothetical protein
MPSIDNSPIKIVDDSTMRRPGVVHQRRAKRAEIVNGVNTTRSPTSKASGSSRKSASKDDSPSPWTWLWANLLQPAGSYVFQILGLVFRALKFPLAALIIILVLSRASSHIRHSIVNTLAPVCAVPFSSYFMPFCAEFKKATPEENGPPFEGLVNIQAKFEDVIDGTSMGYSLPWDMKLSEMGIRDVATLVKHSNLPSKLELELEMQTFIDTARETADEIMSFNSGVNSAVDKVINTNTWTSYTLTDLQHKKDHPPNAAIKFLSSLNPANAFRPHRSIEQRVFDLYLKHTAVLEEEITSLIRHAHSILLSLNFLEEQVKNIGGIVARDNGILSNSHDEVLAALWTKLGGNRRKLRSIEDNFKLIQLVAENRRRAYMHISAALIKLQTIERELEDLRSRVATPGVVGLSGDFPLGYYLSLIESGAKRLQEMKIEASSRQRTAIREMNKHVPSLDEGNWYLKKPVVAQKAEEKASTA